MAQSTKTKFNAWFKRKKFRNFVPSEFTSYFETYRYGEQNEFPDQTIWNNIVEPLRLVDDLRDYFNRPCVITSSYRGYDYNRACGGVSGSQHRHFRALDIVVSGVSPQDVYSYLLERRRAGDFKGGLGLYATFVHVDTRGTNATW